MSFRQARLAALAFGLLAYPLACTRDDDAPAPPADGGGAAGRGGGATGAGTAGAGPAGAGPTGGGGQPGGGGGAGAGQGGGGGAGGGGAGGVVATFTNPVLAADFPDPFVLYEGGTYYAFATNAGPRRVQVTSSTDLTTWQPAGNALPDLPSWGAPKLQNLTWAPSVLKRVVGSTTTFVLYYTTRHAASNFQCIGRAVASAPQGPYVDDSIAPLVCQVDAPEAFCGSIDPDPFVDPATGAAYLFWKSDENATACRQSGGNTRLWSQRLTDDGLGLTGSRSGALLERDQDWEAAPFGGGTLIENPAMVFEGGTYYLFYSANWYESADYAVGYGECEGPLGPCTKLTTDASGGPLFRSSAEALGPGGESFFTAADGRRFMAYHAWTAPATTYAQGGARSLRVEPLTFEGGVPVIAGPTTTPQPAPLPPPAL